MGSQNSNSDTKDNIPKITFGIIVLNGEPFTRYCLRSLYPYAHQIIVVEGAVPAASKIATDGGHSSDSTLEIIKNFIAEEDPEQKITLVTAEDEGHSNGFWPGEKDEMSQVYARRATGDYLWQVDVDEFYKDEDIIKILKFLKNNPSITSLSFKMITFWGGFKYTTDGWYLRRGGYQYHRLFRWKPGYQYVNHRPPTVHNDKGQDLRELKWISAKEMAKQGIYLYHYSLVFPKQVQEKCAYYTTASWANRNRAELWANEAFMQLKSPYSVHNVYEYPSWLEYFHGEHPQQIKLLQQDIFSHKLNIELRCTEDIEKILHSFGYQMGRTKLKAEDFIYRASRLLVHRWKQGLQLTRNILSTKNFLF